MRGQIRRFISTTCEQDMSACILWDLRAPGSAGSMIWLIINDARYRHPPPLHFVYQTLKATKSTGTSVNQLERKLSSFPNIWRKRRKKVWNGARSNLKYTKKINLHRSKMFYGYGMSQQPLIILDPDLAAKYTNRGRPILCSEVPIISLRDSRRTVRSAVPFLK